MGPDQAYYKPRDVRIRSMVFIAGTKYACQRCIRGHRASGCKHIDEELLMIKPKGRPTIWCGRCNRNWRSRRASAGGKAAHDPDVAVPKCNCGVPEKFPAAPFRSDSERHAISRSTPSKEGDSSNRQSPLPAQMKDDQAVDDSIQSPPYPCAAEPDFGLAPFYMDPSVYSFPYDLGPNGYPTPENMLSLPKLPVSDLGMMKPSFTNIGGGFGVPQSPTLPLSPPSSGDGFEEPEDIATLIPNMSALY